MIGLPGNAHTVAVGQRAAQPYRGDEESHGSGAQRELAPPGLVQCHMITGPPCITGREQRGRGGVERQVRARDGKCGCAAGDGPQVQGSGDRGQERADQADPDEPERAVDQIWQAVRPGTGEDVEDQRRYERPDRQRDQQRMEGMAFGTGQQGTVHSAWIPRRKALDRRAAVCGGDAAEGLFAVREPAILPGGGHGPTMACVWEGSSAFPGRAETREAGPATGPSD